MNHKTVPVLDKQPKILHRPQWVEVLRHRLVQSSQSFHIELGPAASLAPAGQRSAQVTFPRVLLQDGQSEIHLALFVHSSHRLHLGAIRQLCGDPMLFTTVVEEWIRKPEKGIPLEELPRLLQALPTICGAARKRIHWMQKLWARERHLRAIEARICPELAGRLKDQVQIKATTQWQLYNLTTHHIACEAPPEEQLGLLLAASRLFKL